MDDPSSSSRTTEVRITSEVNPDATPGRAKPTESEETSEPAPPRPSYQVTISSNSRLANHGPSTGALGSPTPRDISNGPRAVSASRNLTTGRMKRRAAFEANNAAWSYAKIAILFSTAMLVTWIPSSANRVYSVIHRGEQSIPLEYLSAFVLPLQGFWNAVIYIVFSRAACKVLFEDMFCPHRKAKAAPTAFPRMAPIHRGTMWSRKGRGDRDSIAELTDGSWPVSHEPKDVKIGLLPALAFN
jgi:hypothetical protein